MTTRMVRHAAKELAGQFYDQQRSERFRRLNPSQRAFVRQHWQSFVDLGRRALVGLLTQAGYPEYLKEKIMEDLIEDNARAHAPGAVVVAQATLDKPESEDRRLVDANPQLLVSGQ